MFSSKKLTLIPLQPHSQRSSTLSLHLKIPFPNRLVFFPPNQGNLFIAVSITCEPLLTLYSLWYCTWNLFLLITYLSIGYQWPSDGRVRNTRELSSLYLITYVIALHLEEKRNGQCQVWVLSFIVKRLKHNISPDTRNVFFSWHYKHLNYQEKMLSYT